MRAATDRDPEALALECERQLLLPIASGAVVWRTLDQLLTDKDRVASEIRTAVARRAEQFGVAIVSVGIRDIVLPGDMKTILNRVIEAQKRAEANLILRREETAAARIKANTARLLAENPVLLRLKELEAVEATVRGSRATFVFGPGELAPQVKSLVAAKDGE